VLALSSESSGGGTLEPISAFMTNRDGSAIANAVGPIRQVVHHNKDNQRRYLVIAPVQKRSSALRFKRRFSEHSAVAGRTGAES
jgi:hypothetical protein